MEQKQQELSPGEIITTKTNGGRENRFASKESRHGKMKSLLDVRKAREVELEKMKQARQPAVQI